MEAVFHIGFVVKNTSADTQDHRPMPAHQHLKSIVIAPADEAIQQLAVGSRSSLVNLGLSQQLNE